MKRLIQISLLLVLLCLTPISLASAQDEQPDGPIYIVQPGDTLSSIALRFGVTVDDLIQANLLVDPNRLPVDYRLVIPGLTGVNGVLTTETVQFGESLRSVSRQYQVPQGQLARLNRLVSPAELYVGSNVVLPVNEAQGLLGGRLTLNQGQSLLELGILMGVNPWSLVWDNGFRNTQAVLPGDILFSREIETQGPGALPPTIGGVDIQPFPLVQGRTATIAISTDQEAVFGGSLVTTDMRTSGPIARDLHFFPLRDEGYIALQGVHVMTDPGLYPLTLMGELSDGGRFSFTQFVAVRDGAYGYDRPLNVDPETLKPEITQPEDLLWASLTEPATPEMYWEGLFQSPSPFPDCRNSVFGQRRSYNGSPYNFYHSGLDFCGGAGVEIRAPADGRVVFASPLTVRGNATVIDHGWGVFTAYEHQSEIFVEEGESVKAGELIGLVGATGRVEGAHLHWEVIVGGIQVEPVEWLEAEYP